MTHPIHRVISFEIVSDYTTLVRFEDNTEQVIDFEPMLAGALYGPLRDVRLFRQVRLDPEVGTSSGLTMPTSTRQFSMIGRSDDRRCGHWLVGGRNARRESVQVNTAFASTINGASAFAGGTAECQRS